MLAPRSRNRRRRVVNALLALMNPPLLTKASVSLRSTAKPPYPVPKFNLKQHWHRRASKDAQNKWVRALVYSLFNEEVDEWKAHRP
jgi:hypothetical protein